MADSVNWTTLEFSRVMEGRRTRRLTSVEHMLHKGRALLNRLARHPGVVGYAWGRWQDEPGEQPPFASGVVHVNGNEAREHTELLRHFNSRAENMHRIG